MKLIRVALEQLRAELRHVEGAIEALEAMQQYSANNVGAREALHLARMHFEQAEKE